MCGRARRSSWHFHCCAACKVQLRGFGYSQLGMEIENSIKVILHASIIIFENTHFSSAPAPFLAPFRPILAGPPADPLLERRRENEGILVTDGGGDGLDLVVGRREQLGGELH